MDGGAWWATVHGVAKSQTRLNDFTFTFHFHALEKEMATRSSVLAWRIPGTGEPGGLLSVGLHSQTQLKRLSSSKGMWVGKNKPCLQRKMSRYIWLEVGFSQYKRGVGGWVGNNLEQGSEYQIKEFKLLSGKKMPKVFSFNFKKVYI